MLEFHISHIPLQTELCNKPIHLTGTIITMKENKKKSHISIILVCSSVFNIIKCFRQFYPFWFLFHVLIVYLSLIVLSEALRSSEKLKKTKPRYFFSICSRFQEFCWPFGSTCGLHCQRHHAMFMPNAFPLPKTIRLQN